MKRRRALSDSTDVVQESWFEPRRSSVPAPVDELRGDDLADPWLR